MKLNKTKWDLERLSTEAEIRQRKADIRSKDMADWQEWANLRSLKAQAGLLYKIRAHVRGKLHQQFTTSYGPGSPAGTTVKTITELTLEDQAQVVKRALDEYLLPEEVLAAVGT